jgi:hypothetical protein
MTEFALSTETRLTAGVLLLSVVAVESGEPNRFIWLVYAGATSLAIGAVTLGIGVLTGP